MRRTAARGWLGVLRAMGARRSCVRRRRRLMCLRRRSSWGVIGVAITSRRTSTSPCRPRCPSQWCRSRFGCVRPKAIPLHNSTPRMVSLWASAKHIGTRIPTKSRQKSLSQTSIAGLRQASRSVSGPRRIAIAGGRPRRSHCASNSRASCHRWVVVTSTAMA